MIVERAQLEGKKATSGVDLVTGRAVSWHDGKTTLVTLAGTIPLSVADLRTLDPAVLRAAPAASP